MKKHINVVLILSLLMNVIQFIVIINNNSKIETLQYTKQQVLDIFQVTSELEQDLYKYENDTKLGTYYYQAIGKVSWILTYMQYNVTFKDGNDPLYQFNLALSNLFGFMINEQGKELVVSHSSEIRALLHEISSAHREARTNDRNKTIVKFKEYLDENLSIGLNESSSSNAIEQKSIKRDVPTIPLPRVIETR